MTSQALIEKFLKEGIFLTPETAEIIEESKADEIIAASKKKNIVFLDRIPEARESKESREKKDAKDPKEEADTKPSKPDSQPDKAHDKKTSEKKDKDIEKPQPDPQPASDIEVKVESYEYKERMKPEDFVEFYNSRYNSLKGILLGKLRPVSINKTAGSYSDVEVIGMVKELKPNGFVLEDPSGEIEVVSNPKQNPTLGLDDVIGVRGAVKDGRLFPTDIIQPDIPLANEVNSLEGTIVLSHNKIPYKGLVVTPIAVYDNEKKTALPNPGKITLSKGKSKISILIYKPEDDLEKPEPAPDPLAMLKKRHLRPGKRPVGFKEDVYAITQTPDIFWLVSNADISTIYKGVSVVSFGPEKSLRIDLGTREVNNLG